MPEHTGDGEARAEPEEELDSRPADVRAREGFREARDAAMRGERLLLEGDLPAAYDAETAAFTALEKAHDAMEEVEGAGS